MAPNTREHLVLAVAIVGILLFLLGQSFTQMATKRMIFALTALWVLVWMLALLFPDKWPS